MLAAIVRTSLGPRGRNVATGYRCPRGCWWESGGCYCPDEVQLRGAPLSGAGTVIGIGLAGALLWGILGISALASKAKHHARRQRSLRGSRARSRRR